MELQQTLKEYVDTTSKAQYNFLYLRIGKQHPFHPVRLS